MREPFFSIVAVLLLVIIVYSFSKAADETKDEMVVECSFVRIICPDTFLAVCNSIYDFSTRTCINCIPDCTGHENQTGYQTNASGMILCPEVSPLPDFCNEGKIETAYNDIGCVISYRCVE